VRRGAGQNSGQHLGVFLSFFLAGPAMLDATGVKGEQLLLRTHSVIEMLRLAADAASCSIRENTCIIKIGIRSSF
jgi:hypothetical protein